MIEFFDSVISVASINLTFSIQRVTFIFKRDLYKQMECFSRFVPNTSFYFRKFNYRLSFSASFFEIKRYSSAILKTGQKLQYCNLLKIKMLNASFTEC